MYINNFSYPHDIKKDDSKCGRIFRPWDSESAEKKIKDNSQDCTVSTTTQEDEDIICMTTDDIIKSEVSCESNKTKHIKVKDCISPFSTTLNSTVCPEKSETPTSNSNSPSNRSRLLSDVTLKSDLTNSLPLQSSQHFQDTTLYHKHDQKHIAPPETLLQTSPLSLDFIQDPYNPVYPDLMQTNLAQHLGLPPNDPLLMESIAQGYALEEYARVLNQEQQAKLLAAKKQRPKKYKCPHCGVGFSNNGQLKGHVRIHTGERPFKCDDKECGKTFTRNEELTRHKRIHSGLRPFPCTHCGKRFGRKDHLKKHSRTHFQPRGLYAVPVVLPFEAWASGQTNGYPFFPMMY